ncbi:hypothetical protein BKP37_12945 [Anaerobacillus alkalilacustris]|uniref:Uncharacterized protein n=1 Tax=Anaerobacillus alkalilacustris TaxID=393763 RepID=A0A1S2LJV2_9BACI|nr:hypothetical protein [Anaerobacillus alkalilacustris]OIJ12701.1 hypothetical protein BKP37_12945 [Anaerobacillus alkalilacustris]
MKFKVYYDEIDGELRPMWLILPVNIDGAFSYYSLQAPFERFYPEEFYGDMKNVTVSQGELVRCVDDPYSFGISLDLLTNYLTKNGYPLEVIHEADNFIVRFDDLEELLQFDVRGIF